MTGSPVSPRMVQRHWGPSLIPEKRSGHHKAICCKVDNMAVQSPGIRTGNEWGRGEWQPTRGCSQQEECSRSKKSKLIPRNNGLHVAMRRRLGRAATIGKVSAEPGFHQLTVHSLGTQEGCPGREVGDRIPQSAQYQTACTLGTQREGVCRTECSLTEAIPSITEIWSAVEGL